MSWLFWHCWSAFFCWINRNKIPNTCLKILLIIIIFATARRDTVSIRIGASIATPTSHHRQKCFFLWTPLLCLTPYLALLPAGCYRDWAASTRHPKEGPKNNLKLRVCVTVIREKTKMFLFLIPKGSEAFRSVAMTLRGGCCCTIDCRHSHQMKSPPYEKNLKHLAM